MDLTGRRVFQAVSLANSAFSKDYARNLMEWLMQQDATSLDICILDAIESINYVVFRQISIEQAVEASRRRALELKNMFEKAIPKGFSCLVELESENFIHGTDLFTGAQQVLIQAYAKHDVFFDDVNAQVKQNLQKRIEKHGEAFINVHLDELSRYILDELAFFYAYFKTYPGAIEVYPGKSMLVKDRLFQGAYKTEGLDYELPEMPTIMDTSFLLEKS